MDLDIYSDEYFKKLDEELVDLNKYLEDLYDYELYQDASLYYFNKKLKEEQ